MSATITIIILLSLIALSLRGGRLHNYLVCETENIFRHAGFSTRQEYPQRLPDGRLDFVDLLVQRGNCMICVEIETSARNILTNASKADQLGLSLIVVVPSRKVQKAVKTKLNQFNTTAGALRVYDLLLAQLGNELTKYFPLFSVANDERENKKSNQNEEF